MNQRFIPGLAAAAALAVVFLPVSSFGQQKSLKDQLLGVWNLISVDYVGNDGSRSSTFGANPKGIAIFEGNGHYILSLMRSDRPNYAVNDRAKGTATENQATAQGTITYFGTYTVNEADRFINIHVVSSSFPNWNGTNQRRRIDIAGDKLSITNPVASTGGGKAEVIWKRAR